MKQRLVSEPALQPLLAQYVPLELKVDEPEFRVWSSRYKPTGNGIPMIFIVSSEGQELYNRSGAPAGDGLAELLLRGIQQTGGFKTPVADGARQEKMLKSLAVARRLLARDEPAAAIALLVPLVEAEADGASPAGQATDPAAAAAGQPSDPQSQIRALLDELQQRAGGELETALASVRDPQQSLLGAVRLLRVQRLYGQLPSLKPALDEGLQLLSAAADGAALLEQAGMIDKAREFEEGKNKRSAVAAYRKVITAHPDTLAARLSQQRIAQLTGASAADPLADQAPRRWSDRSGQYSVLAALVGLDAQSIRIRKEDGEIVTVPRGALSDECRQYVEAVEQ